MKTKWIMASALCLAIPAAAEESRRVTQSLPQMKKARPCLEKPQARALVNYVLPDLLDTAARRCRPSLASTAFLPSAAGQASIARMRAAAAGDWPRAKEAMLRLADNPAAAALPDAALKQMVSAGLPEKFAGNLDLKDCEALDDLMRALDPLPPGEVGTVTAALMVLTDSNPSRKPLICTPGQP